MNQLLDRFLRYVRINTQSDEDAGVIPSFEGERELAQLLAEELTEMGAEEVEVTENCFVFATIPASEGLEDSKTVGMLAHLDTAPDYSGNNVRPIVHEKYDGGIVKLSDSVVIDPEQNPELLRYIGDDIVTSDGTTLLGADDKSGIAIIMSVASELLNNKEIRHGRIRIGFTPDEEVSVGGASIFDVEKFGADVGITVDGDGIGELNYETFNAYCYELSIEGNNIHPAEAKGKMINACSLALEFDSMLPEMQKPEHTEGYEGFIHLCDITGDVEHATMNYIIRDFEMEGLENKKQIMIDAVNSINSRYDKERIVLNGYQEYINPRNLILASGNLMDKCKEAFSLCGIEPLITPIRGGTDGSTLAEKGLPCPNLFLGGHNYHNCREFVSVNAMEKSAEILIKITELLI